MNHCKRGTFTVTFVIFANPRLRTYLLEHHWHLSDCDILLPLFRWSMAEKYFTAALRQVKQISCGSVISEKWESLYNNLGHTCRKLGKFEEALAFHRQALILKPQTASTYSSIGYVQTLQVWKSFTFLLFLTPCLPRQLCPVEDSAQHSVSMLQMFSRLCS